MDRCSFLRTPTNVACQDTNVNLSVDRMDGFIFRHDFKEAFDGSWRQCDPHIITPATPADTTYIIRVVAWLHPHVVPDDIPVFCAVILDSYVKIIQADGQKGQREEEKDKALIL